MGTQFAALALDGGEPRLSTTGQGIAEYSRRALKGIHDPSVSFEEYMYYAKISRAEEEGLAPAKHPFSKLLGINKKTEDVDRRGSVNMPSTEKETTVTQTSPAYGQVNDEEWLRAARAARTATWGAVFYLITTDILGPYSVPWALLQMGYGPGISLYFIFGAAAGYSGYQLWRMFLGLDSTQYPLETYGDVAFRVYGTVARHSVNALQSIQLLFNVGIIILGNGQGISQINPNICFIVCSVIWLACGMFIGQIRTLQRYGWIANLAIWINVSVMIMTMVVVTHSDPNYTAAEGSNEADIGTPNNRPPVVTSAGVPAGTPFEGQIVGLMQAVYSYGGAMLFCNFMGEMRKPMDFWKGMLAAQAAIFCIYIFFGVYVYSYQGQFTINPAMQGISTDTAKAANTAGNVLYFLSGLIAAGLYGNIGIKVLYQNVLKEIFNLPDLTARSGKLIWVALVPIYWAIAFIIASAIPQFSNLSGLVAALCILQFTYTFPPFLYIGYMIKRDAMQEGEGFDPATGNVVRHDSGMKRWARGLKKGFVYKFLNLLYLLGAAATAILGIYSSVKSMVDAYQSNPSRQSSFSCNSPVA